MSEIILKGDTEDFEKGLVVTTVKIDDSHTDTTDWHPEDEKYAKEWAEETAHCENVESVSFYTHRTGKTIVFRGDKI